MYYDFDEDLNSADIRVVEGKDGEPWFVAKDVAEALGYCNTSKAVNAHCKRVQTCPTKMGGQVRHIQIIPESDLYRLILKSKHPSAERFEMWVMEEVLPTIRKTGGTYMSDDALMKTLEDPDYMIGVLQKLKQIKEARADIIDIPPQTKLIPE